MPVIPLPHSTADGNLFVGGIAFNRVKPSNGDVYVATYGTNPSRLRIRSTICAR